MANPDTYLRKAGTQETGYEFSPGDFVTIAPDSEFSYEVAEIRKFPHGVMVGIYDEPPSKHIDYWHFVYPAHQTSHIKHQTSVTPRNILIDCDGVLTDGALTIDRNGEKMFKRFHTRDVRAIRELVYNGYEVTIVTADEWPGIFHFAEKVGADVMVARDKSQIRCGGILPFIAVGDDAWDLPMLQRAGYPHAFCPIDADKIVRQDTAVTVLDTAGGRGVVAELAHRILTTPPTD